MERIYHEKQQGQCCAQHCLNSLLQGSYFTPDALACIASDLDEKERITRQGNELQSQNSDDSGNFSIQVIVVALQNIGLELVPYQCRSIDADAARRDPTTQQAFICHFNMHWLAIRRLGNQWFDLNSLHACPRLISKTYLSLYLKQLSFESYSIWFVSGNFPECEADLYLMTHSIPESYLTEPSKSNRKLADMYEIDTQRAIEISQETETRNPFLQRIFGSAEEEAEEREIEEALRLSTQLYSDSHQHRGAAIASSSMGASNGSSEEDLDLQEAIKLSLQDRESSQGSSKIHSL